MRQKCDVQAAGHSDSLRTLNFGLAGRIDNEEAIRKLDSRGRDVKVSVAEELVTGKAIFVERGKKTWGKGLCLFAVKSYRRGRHLLLAKDNRYPKMHFNASSRTATRTSNQGILEPGGRR